MFFFIELKYNSEDKHWMPVDKKKKQKQKQETLTFAALNFI